MNKMPWVVVIVGVAIVAALIVLYCFGLLGNAAIAAVLSPS